DKTRPLGIVFFTGRGGTVTWGAYACVPDGPGSSRTMNAPLKCTLLLSMLSLLALGSCSKAPPPPPSLPEVTVAKVISKRIKDWDEYTGRFQAVDTVEVRPRASGYVEQVLFHEGQAVKRDDVLVIIDPRPYQADYDRAKAGLEL